MEEERIEPSGLSCTLRERACLSVLDDSDMTSDAILLCGSFWKSIGVNIFQTCNLFIKLTSCNPLTHFSGNIPIVIPGKYNEVPLRCATSNNSEPRGAQRSTSAI